MFGRKTKGDFEHVKFEMPILNLSGDYQVVSRWIHKYEVQGVVRIEVIN